jgi:hypothetical protein
MMLYGLVLDNALNVTKMRRPQTVECLFDALRWFRGVSPDFVRE